MPKNPTDVLKKKIKAASAAQERAASAAQAMVAKNRRHPIKKAAFEVLAALAAVEYPHGVTLPVLARLAVQVVDPVFTLKASNSAATTLRLAPEFSGQETPFEDHVVGMSAATRAPDGAITQLPDWPGEVSLETTLGLVLASLDERYGRGGRTAKTSAERVREWRARNPERAKKHRQDQLAREAAMAKILATATPTPPDHAEKDKDDPKAALRMLGFIV